MSVNQPACVAIAKLTSNINYGLVDVSWFAPKTKLKYLFHMKCLHNGDKRALIDSEVRIRQVKQRKHASKDNQDKELCHKIA